MAAELVRYGIPVRLIDRSAEPTQTSKALVLWSRTLELIERMGCTPAFLDAGLAVRAASIRSGASVLGRAGFDDISSPYNFALMIPQRDTERLLHEQLVSIGGAVEREVELMQDAFNLAWKLALVARGEAGANLLDSYSPERSTVGNMVLRNASLITDMATLSSPAALAVRNIVLRLILGLHAVQDRMATTMSEIEIGYAGRPLSKGRHAGRRLDPKHYGGTPPGAGTIPRWILYTTGFAKDTAMAKRFPTLLEPAPREPEHPTELLIVRPDAYVGFCAGQDWWGEAEKYLEALAPAVPEAF